MAQFLPSFCCQTCGLIFNSIEFFCMQSRSSVNDLEPPWSCGPNHRPSTTMLDSWHNDFVLTCCVWFLLNLTMCIVAKHLHTSSVNMTSFQKSCGLFRFANLSHAAVFNAFAVFFEMPWTLTFNIRTEMMLLGFFALSLSFAWCHRGVNLLRC